MTRSTSRIRFLGALAIARLALFATKLGRSGGSSLPGKILYSIAPDALRQLRNRHRHATVVLVSATNGKTTLTTMLANMCTAASIKHAHNATGANLRSGIATTMMLADREVSVILLETDEATLPVVISDLNPNIVLLGNLFRDQLDRFGELETLADAWLKCLTANKDLKPLVVGNCDDPLIEWLMQNIESDTRSGVSVKRFGIELGGSTKIAHASDSTECRRCGKPFVWTAVFIAHLGHYQCPNCGFTRGTPKTALVGFTQPSLEGSEISIRLGDAQPVDMKINVPGLFNAANVLAASAAASALKISNGDIRTGAESFVPVFGRFESINLTDGRSLHLILAKNPAGMNEVIRTVADSNVRFSRYMIALNDRVADGRDTSWIWDADIEPILEKIDSQLVVTGTRSAEMALRCVYGGLPPDMINHIPELSTALEYMIEPDSNDVCIFATYTAMLDIQHLLTSRGLTGKYWQRKQEESV